MHMIKQKSALRRMQIYLYYNTVFDRGKTLTTWSGHESIAGRVVLPGNVSLNEQCGHDYVSYRN